MEAVERKDEGAEGKEQLVVSFDSVELPGGDIDTIVVIPAFECRVCRIVTNRFLVCQNGKCGSSGKRTLVEQRIGHWLKLLQLPASQPVTAQAIAELLGVPHLASRVGQFTGEKGEPLGVRIESSGAVVKLWAFNWVGVRVAYQPNKYHDSWLPIPLGAFSITLVGANGCGKTKLAEYGLFQPESPLLILPIESPTSNKFRFGEKTIVYSERQWLAPQPAPQDSGVATADQFLRKIIEDSPTNLAMHTPVPTTDSASPSVMPTTMGTCAPSPSSSGIYNRFLRLVRQVLDVQFHVDHQEFQFRRNDGSMWLPLHGLSTGQRSAIYLILRVLAAGEGATVVIDEPEVYLNPALVKRLLDMMEQERPDCFFVFITHHYQIVEHIGWRGCPAVWVEGLYTAKVQDNLPVLSLNWRFSELPVDGSQGELLAVLGSYERKVLFVEGKDDTEPFRIAFGNGYQVIPMHGCTEVISTTRAMRRYREMYPHIPLCFGLVDRDRRHREEIKALQLRGIETLHVTTIESLYLMPELLEACANDIWSSKPDDAHKLSEAVAQAVQNLYVSNREQQRVRHVFSVAKYLRGQARRVDPGDESTDSVANYFLLDQEDVADIMQQAEEDVTIQLNKLDQQLQQPATTSADRIVAVLALYKHRPNSHTILQDVLKQPCVRRCSPRQKVIQANEWKLRIHNLMRARDPIEEARDPTGEALRKAFRSYAGEESWDQHPEVATPPPLAPLVSEDAGAPDDKKWDSAWKDLVRHTRRKVKEAGLGVGDQGRVTIYIFSKTKFLKMVRATIDQAEASVPKEANINFDCAAVREWRGKFQKALKFQGFDKCWPDTKTKKAEYRDLWRVQEPHRLLASAKGFFFNDDNIKWPIEGSLLKTPEAQNHLLGCLQGITADLLVVPSEHFEPRYLVEVERLQATGLPASSGVPSEDSERSTPN